MSVEHLSLHVPFCDHRSAYCDFVTVTGQDDLSTRSRSALVPAHARQDLQPAAVLQVGLPPATLAAGVRWSAVRSAGTVPLYLHTLCPAVTPKPLPNPALCAHD